MFKMHFLFSFFIILCFSCSKNEEQSDCIDRILSDYNMKPYKEGDIYCASLQLFEFENNHYFVYDLCTADIAWDPFDCNKVYYARTNGEFDTLKTIEIWKKSKKLGIIGVSK